MLELRELQIAYIVRKHLIAHTVELDYLAGNLKAEKLVLALAPYPHRNFRVRLSAQLLNDPVRCPAYDHFIVHFHNMVFWLEASAFSRRVFHRAYDKNLAVPVAYVHSETAVFALKLYFLILELGRGYEPRVGILPRLHHAFGRAVQKVVILRGLCVRVNLVAFYYVAHLAEKPQRAYVEGGNSVEVFFGKICGLRFIAVKKTCKQQ